MDVERLLGLARKLVDEVTFCIACTRGDGEDVHARVVQPLPLTDDWVVDMLTNRRCRKVREVDRTGRTTLLYYHEQDRSYVALSGSARIVEDVERKRAIWTSGHDRWNPNGPEDPATVFARLVTERIELWSAVHDVVPEPAGYSAAVLIRDGHGWRYEAT